MYELYPYFTNDGTVGLFSPVDDDIYHSTYGALTESWQKFIQPSMLEQYIKNNDSVKILDICYGIGYNTKTALQVFVNNILRDNNFNNFCENNIKNTCRLKDNIAEIDSDNISNENIKQNNHKNEIYEERNSINSLRCNSQIDTDNIIDGQDEIKPNYFKKILIDSVDIDKILINLSPFITNGLNSKTFPKNLPINKYLSQNVKDKLQQIQKIKNSKINLLPNNLRLKNEVSIILLEKLLESDSQFLNDKILQTILSQKKYSSYFSKYMINLAKFYLNQGYNYNKIENKLTYLHNIYSLYLALRARYRQYIQ